MAKRKIAAPSSPIEISLPATSANLGAAFDAAALAFPLRLTITAKSAADFRIVARGRDASLCALGSGGPDQNLILQTYMEVLQQHGIAPSPLALNLRNEIPIGKGCGSSAAARLAGIALAVHFGRLQWDANRIMAEASRREHHPDNTTACWLGGVTLARMDAGDYDHKNKNDALKVVRVRPKGNWPLLLAVPNHSLSTEEARRVLPQTYSRADAVANIQSALFMLAAFSQNRGEWLRYGLEDRIHQPYRSPLCPLLAPLQQLAQPPDAGILGVALSGAGPSVLAFLDPAVSVTKTRRRVASYLQKHGLRAELILTSIAPQGVIRKRI